MGLEMAKFQFVWRKKPKMMFRKFNEDSSWSYIYEWVLMCGFIEIRRWSRKKINR